MHRCILTIGGRPEAALAAITAAKKTGAERIFLRVDMSINTFVTNAAHALEGLSGRLDALSPYNVLDRGFSFVADDKGNAVTSVSSLQPGTAITVRMKDGRLKADITDKEVF